MKATRVRFFYRLVPAILLSALLLNLPGLSILPANALTTTVNDFGPIAIPDAPAGLSCTNPIIRNINVAANVVVADLNVRLNISHIRRSDVRVTLTSPAGTTAVLISGAGLGSPVIDSPDDYDNYDVILDDTSVGSLYDNDNDNVGGGADRTARPYELLSAFKGQSTAGIWAVTICDTRNITAGTYNRTTLTFISADPNTIAGTSAPRTAWMILDWTEEFDTWSLPGTAPVHLYPRNRGGMASANGYK